jgi:putative lipoprotein
MNALGRVLAVAVVIVVVVGCKAAPGPEPTSIEDASQASARLEGTSWVAESIGGEPVAEGFASTLTFEADDRISGSAGCNGYFGSWGLEGDEVVFGHIGATMMMCPDEQMEQERRFLEALNGTDRFRINAGKLELFSATGEQSMVLSPLGASPAAESTER